MKTSKNTVNGTETEGDICAETVPSPGTVSVELLQIERRVSDDLRQRNAALRAEIERLTRELEEERSLLCTTMVERLRAENERLKALVAIGECSECGNPLTEKHSLHCRALEGGSA